MEVIIVTGLSGAGKSQAINCLEDMGYYCIDNMPPALIKNFMDLSMQDKMKIEKAAFVIDIRGGEFFDDLKSSLSDLKHAGMRFKIMFLEASDEVLIRRFNETRRTHPLACAGNTLQGITEERERLMEIRKISDYIIDTSNMKSAKLSEEIKKLLLSEEGSPSFTISIQSFGYKHGIPLDADIVFDMRFIPNPYYLASMRKLTGNSEKVRNYVMKFPETKEFVTRVHELINTLIPFYIREGKSHLVVAFGCTGGQHRSVAMANEFSERFLAEGKRVVTVHRNLS
ncbi:RNase adapter RapZ [Sinanaerobacter chloroacetimidivorans]|uniref:RNase adapter RapZ n=1 Tax=Sinanaerobacter chloroacetimidivorans TaxID=2818044 RepID=A0A8J8B419_9FIRM|nr:RNase adapter RapZ [Sinanaerobacter chloroacetimidivorans]MBR0600341.1 RNase adapter RapZ [Sinanaerobacter chloroacetimidivorans]